MLFSSTPLSCVLILDKYISHWDDANINNVKKWITRLRCSIEEDTRKHQCLSNIQTLNKLLDKYTSCNKEDEESIKVIVCKLNTSRACLDTLLDEFADLCPEQVKNCRCKHDDADELIKIWQELSNSLDNNKRSHANCKKKICEYLELLKECKESDLNKKVNTETQCKKNCPNKNISTKDEILEAIKDEFMDCFINTNKFIYSLDQHD